MAVDHVVLSTHVNADGDGTGSQAAVAGWLAALGKHPYIVNPTAFPNNFRYLVDPSWIVDLDDPRLSAVYAKAQLLLVLDTGEPKRIGKVLNGMAGKPI